MSEKEKKKSITNEDLKDFEPNKNMTTASLGGDTRNITYFEKKDRGTDNSKMTTLEFTERDARKKKH